MGGLPPIHMPFAFDCAILSRMRSAVTSRSNCANDSSMFNVSRPMLVVVLNDCVIETKLVSAFSNVSTPAGARNCSRDGGEAPECTAVPVEPFVDDGDD